MTKSTITREQLEEWVAQFDEDGGCDATDRQLEALIRQSLAAMDSEPDYKERKLFCSTDTARMRKVISASAGSEATPIYRHAQPVPVVPDEKDKTVDADDHPLLWSFNEGWNACRAAMLKGQPQNAPQNIPEIIPDCWCRTCRPVVLNDMRFVVCPDCGNKRCPRANDHRNACTGSNEPGQEGSAYPASPQSPGSEPATVPGKWIPVSERMPEAGGDMIVFTDGIVMSGVSYAKKKGFYIQALEYDDDEPVDSVTHWMPLPDGPKEAINALIPLVSQNEREGK